MQLLVCCLVLPFSRSARSVNLGTSVGWYEPMRLFTKVHTRHIKPQQVFGEQGWNWLGQLGSSTALLVLDTRMERSRAQVGCMLRGLLCYAMLCCAVLCCALVYAIWSLCRGREFHESLPLCPPLYAFICQTACVCSLPLPFLLCPPHHLPVCASLPSTDPVNRLMVSSQAALERTSEQHASCGDRGHGTGYLPQNPVK